MNTPIFTLGPKPKRDVVWRALPLPGGVLVVTVALTVWTGRTGWLSVGGEDEERAALHLAPWVITRFTHIGNAKNAKTFGCYHSGIERSSDRC
jgi:hypothetical protein